MVSLALDLTVLTSELSDADSGLAPASLLSIRLGGSLSAASRSALLLLPSLTRLDWRGRVPASKSTAPSQSSLPPSPLQQLHLDFDSDHGGAVELLQQAAIRAPQLRGLRVARPPPSFDQLIRPLRSLRLLDVTLSQSSLPPELVQSLATLPLFTELVVREESLWPFELTAETLRCIAESRSWRLVRLIGRHERPLLTLPVDVNTQLAERLVDFRVQGEWHSGTSEQRLMISADGAATWQQTAI
jgi:hypothetical protein